MFRYLPSDQSDGQSDGLRQHVQMPDMSCQVLLKSHLSDTVTQDNEVTNIVIQETYSTCDCHIRARSFICNLFMVTHNVNGLIDSHRRWEHRVSTHCIIK